MYNKTRYLLKKGIYRLILYISQSILLSLNIIRYCRSLYNISRYGWSAPKFGEIIYVNPQQCNRYIDGDIIKELFGLSKRNASGLVIDSMGPFNNAELISESKRFKSCIEHWVFGLPWEDTGIYEFQYNLICKKGSADNCKNMDDIKNRYKNLDLVFDQVQSEGRLRTKKEADSEKNWPGKEGVVHIGPKGEPFYGGGSHHRFAIAYILKIPFPALIGIVHVSAIPYLAQYRIGRSKKNFNP